MAAKKKEAEETIELKEIEPRSIIVTVEGISDLQTHRFGETALASLRGTTNKKAAKAGKKPARDPEAEYKEALYRFGEGKVGVPAIMFKKSMVNAVRIVHGMTMATAKQMFFTVGTDPEWREFCAVENVAPSIHEAIVPAGGGKGATLSYRAIYGGPWRIRVGLEFIEGVISDEQIINLLNLAGFSVGIGCQRPERGGQYGRFKVVQE